MGYFDDIQFTSGAVLPNCRAVVDRRTADTCSVEMILAGRMAFGIDEGPRVVLDQPAVFWHHPRHSYQYGAVDERGWDHQFVVMRGPRALRLVEEGFMPLASAGYVVVREAEAAARLFREMLPHLAALPAALATAELTLLVERLLCRLLRERLADPGPSRLLGALDVWSAAVTRNPEQPWELAAEAQRLGVSYTHLRRLFREHFGMAPHAYVLQCRVQTAARLLVDSPALPLKQLALLAGFPDPLQMGRVFRQRLGVTPGRYRIITALSGRR